MTDQIETYRDLIDAASSLEDVAERGKQLDVVFSQLIASRHAVQEAYDNLIEFCNAKVIEADKQLKQEFIRQQIGETSDPIQSYRALIEEASDLEDPSTRKARLNALLWPAKELDESLFSLCFEKIQHASRRKKEDWTESRPDLYTPEYLAKSTQEKAIYWGSAMHGSMRSQAESGYDEFAFFSNDWIKSMHRHESDFLPIMELIYANWAGQWDVKTIRQRIKSVLLEENS